MAKWYLGEGEQSDVVISTRIRLARNLADYPFPARLDTKTRVAVNELVRDAGPAAANDDNGGLYASYKIDTQVGFSPSAFVNIEDHISKVVDSGNVSNGSGAVTYDISYTAAATQQDKDAVAALKKATSLKNLKVTVTEPGQPEQ